MLLNRQSRLATQNNQQEDHTDLCQVPDFQKNVTECYQKDIVLCAQVFLNVYTRPTMTSCPMHLHRQVHVPSIQQDDEPCYLLENGAKKAFEYHKVRHIFFHKAACFA